MSEQLVALSRCTVGAIGVIRRVAGSRSHRRRLAELGFVSGARLEVVGRAGVGGVVLAVADDARVALDRATATNVHIEPLTRPAPQAGHDG